MMTDREYDLEEARLERAIEQVDVLYYGANSPEDPDNYSEAIGAMGPTDWARIVKALRENTEFAVPLLNSMVDDYWHKQSLKEVTG